MPEMIKKPIAPHFALLVILSALNAVAMNIFLPSMPSLTENLNTQYSLSQLTLTLYLFALGFAQLIIGPLSDKYGRRPILLIFVALFVIASLACANAENIQQLILFRILQAIGGCSGMVVTRAIIKDLYSKEKAASFIGYTTMTVTIMPMLAPIIGGFIDQYYGWRMSFVAVSGLGIIGLIYTFTNLYETNLTPVKKIDLKRIWIRYVGLLKNTDYLTYIFAMTFSTSVFYAFIAGAPFVATKIMGLKPFEYGYYFVMVSMGYMFGNFLSGRLAQTLGNMRMIHLANLLLFIGMLVLTTAAFFEFKYHFTLFLPMTFVACANGISIPNSFALALSVKPKIAGAASGLGGFIQISIGAVFTYLVGFFHNDTVYPMVFMMLFGATICLIIPIYLSLRTKLS